jgi:hypothetical protein
MYKSTIFDKNKSQQYENKKTQNSQRKMAN